MQNIGRNMLKEFAINMLSKISMCRLYTNISRIDSNIFIFCMHIFGWYVQAPAKAQNATGRRCCLRTVREG